MPITSPTKSLTSVIVREFFPATAASATAPAFAATYLGPIRTVVPAEKGLLGGFEPNALAPVLPAVTPYVEFYVEWAPRTSTFTAGSSLQIQFGRAIFKDSCASFNGAREAAQAIVDRFLSDGFTSSLIEKYKIEEVRTPVSPTPGTGTDSVTKITIYFSKSAIDRGILPGVIYIGGAHPHSSAGDFALVDSSFAPLTVVAPPLLQTIIQPVVPSSLNIDYPALQTNWSKVITKEISQQVLFDMDTEWERFHFDTTDSAKTAVSSELAKTFPNYAFRDDLKYVTCILGLSNITVSREPIPGTQRVTAFDMNTGVEYELRHYSDSVAITNATPAATDYDYTTTLVTDDGAYVKGTTIVFNPLSSFFTTHIPNATPGSFILRAVYVPKRFSTPRPAYNFKSLIPGGTDVLVGAGIGDYTIDTASTGFVTMPVKVDAPSSTDITYTRNSVVPNTVLPLTYVAFPSFEDIGKLQATTASSFTVAAIGTTSLKIADLNFLDIIGDSVSLPSFDLFTSNADLDTVFVIKNSAVVTLTSPADYTLDTDTNTIIFTNSAPAQLTPHTVTLRGITPFVDVNLAPKLTKSFSYDASGQNGTTIFLNTPNIESISIKKSDNTLAANITDYTYIAETGALTFIATGSGGTIPITINNPINISVSYSPFVDFVDEPIVEWNLTSSNAPRPSYWVGTWPPVQPKHLGGGRYRAYVSAHTIGNISPPVIDAIGSLALEGKIKYPVAPEVQLEFMADRNDLDGHLYVLPDSTTISNTAELKDVYAGQEIAVDLTPANPTVHAAVIGLTASPGIPVIVGVGDMTPTRSAKILQRLEREFNPYHLVAISQDEDSILSLVGAHVDKVVDTFAGTQVHLNAGKLRVLYVTFDQRNESQVYPTQKDVSTGLARIESKPTGGIQIVTDLASATGINPGDYIELHQDDVTNSDSVLVGGGEVTFRQKSHRFRIVSIDITSGVKFDVVDVNLPGALLYAEHYPLVRPAAYRILRLRDDYTLATTINAKAASIGSLGTNRGRRRWIRQPDMLVLNDGGKARILPGYYRSVIESALRSSTFAHQGFSRYPLPLIESVARGLGFYVSDDVINIMTDGGADYAVQDFPEAPVFSLQQLTADRTNQYTQAPTVTQIVDFVAYALYNAMKIYLGVTNVADETLDMFAATAQATLDRMKTIRASGLGPMIQRGRIISLVPLASTATNSGIIIKFSILPALATEEIQMDIFVDTDTSAI